MLALCRLESARARMGGAGISWRQKLASGTMPSGKRGVGEGPSWRQSAGGRCASSLCTGAPKCSLQNIVSVCCFLRIKIKNILDK